MTQQIFFSHSTADDGAVDRIADAIETHGLRAWVDHRRGIEVGDPSWDEKIRAAIAACDAGVFVMSPAALDSRICAAECLLVRELNKPLYVLRLAEVRPERVWLYIKLIQYADLVRDFDAGIQALLTVLTGSTVGGDAISLPEAVSASITGMETMRVHLPYLSNPLRGRERELHLVQSELGAHVSQIVGTGGVGKSRLAAEVALNHPTGAVWHRCTPTTQSADLLQLLRQHLGLPGDAAQPAVLSALAGRQPLVVIDNAEAVDPGSARRGPYADLLNRIAAHGVPLLLTTRLVWHELKPRREYAPAALSLTIAAQLAHDFAASDGLSLDTSEAEALAQAARLHPRLIEFAIGQLHERDLDRVLKQLGELRREDIREALDEMVVQTVRQMAAQAKNGAQAETLLRRLTWLTESFPLAAVQALAQTELADEDDLDDALATLQRWQFVRRAGEGRYRLGDLVQVALGEPSDSALFDRYADFYTRLALDLFNQPPETWAASADDLPNIHALGDYLLKRTSGGTTGDLERVCEFVNATHVYVTGRLEARKAEWLEMGLAAVRAQRAADPNHTALQRRESLFLGQLGYIASIFGDTNRALEYFEAALPLYKTLNDRRQQGTLLNNIGQIWSMRGDREKALGHYEQALVLRRAVSDKSGEAVTLDNIARVWEAQGDSEKALDYSEQALVLLRAAGDKGSEAITLNNIGHIWSARGDTGKALSYYEQALALHRTVGNKGGEATVLNNLGLQWDERGEYQRAFDHYEQALALHRAVGDRDGQAITLYNLGRYWNDRGDRERALACYEESLSLRRAINDRRGEAITLQHLGLLWYDQGEPGRALDCYEQSLALYRAIGDRSGEGTTLQYMGLIGAEQKDFSRAVVTLEQAVTADPENTLTAYWLALAQLGSGAYEASIETHRRGKTRDLLSQAYAALWCSVAFDLLNQAGAAADEAKRLTELLPMVEPEDAQNRLRALWVLYQGDAAQARQLYEAILVRYRQVRASVFSPRFYLFLLAHLFPQRPEFAEFYAWFKAETEQP